MIVMNVKIELLVEIFINRNTSARIEMGGWIWIFNKVLGGYYLKDYLSIKRGDYVKDL